MKNIPPFGLWSFGKIVTHPLLAVIERSEKLASTTSSPATITPHDSQNQLIREDNQAAGKTWVWIYDEAGNITAKKEYAYTTATVLTQGYTTVSYGYGNTAWGDLLNSYDGKTISYDAIGNPLSDGTWTYTWEQGRQLVRMSYAQNVWNFTYDSNGMRTGRSNAGTGDTYTYVYNGSQLSRMTYGSNTMWFTYGADGKPLSINYNGTTYYYVTNLQGDVVAILNSAGTAVVSYTYDAWGKPLTTTGSMASTLGLHNPLRYRGYVYDQETGLYYLQSRYYNPEWGRFINADNYTSTGQGLLGNNMFVYCGNNPVARIDEGGEFWNWVVGATVGALVGAINTAVEAYKEEGWDAFTSEKTWAKIGVSAACGAINGLVAASGAYYVTGGFVGGLTGAVGSMAHQLIDSDEDFSQINGMQVLTDFAVGMIGGAAGGNGAIRGSKYMAYQGKSFAKHAASNGTKMQCRYKNRRKVCNFSHFTAVFITISLACQPTTLIPTRW